MGFDSKHELAPPTVYRLAGSSPLPLDMGYLLTAAPVLRSCRSNAYRLAEASLTLDVEYLMSESEKVGLKLNIQKTKIMASSPITSWPVDGKTVQTVTDFIFGGSKITADGDCSHEIKRRLLLVRKVMTNLDSILKSRDITLPTEVHLVKAMVFPVVMYGCESWTIKKAKLQLSSKELMLLNYGVGEDS